MANESALLQTALALAPKGRGPIAIAHSHGRLFVANQRSNSITVVSVGSASIEAEHKLEGGVAWVASHPASADVFLLDDVNHALCSVTLPAKIAKTPSTKNAKNSKGLILRRLAEVSPFPTKLIVVTSPPCVVVSSIWARELTIVEFDAAFEQVVRTRKLPLSFAPGELLARSGSSPALLVADAFGGMLASVDLELGRIQSQRELPIHNIRGLAHFANGREVLVSHQLVDAKMWSDRENVHWGLLMANSLRGFRWQGLFDPANQPMQTSWLDAQGLVGNAAGDPGALVVDAKGRIAVALSGVNQVMVDGRSFRRRVPVGQRPVALVVVQDELFVANQLDDSVSVIDLTSGNVSKTIDLGPRSPLTSRDRGERLFFDANMSHNGWMSCHSCHTDGHTSGRLVDTLGDGDYGAPKRVPSLFGVGKSGPWGWTGTAQSLAGQVEKSIRTTMHGRPKTQQDIDDLVAFLANLSSPPVPPNQPVALVRRGRELFARHGCTDCHPAPHYTSPATYDVDLQDAAGNRKFNPPSLRGLRHRNGFFHDARHGRIVEVLNVAKHQLKSELSAEESAAMLAFLESL